MARTVYRLIAAYLQIVLVIVVVVGGSSEHPFPCSMREGWGKGNEEGGKDVLQL